MTDYNVGDVFIIKSLVLPPNEDDVLLLLLEHLINTFGIITRTYYVNDIQSHIWYSNKDQREYVLSPALNIEVIS
jgi:hypothetical protein